MIKNVQIWLIQKKFRVLATPIKSEHRQLINARAFIHDDVNRHFSEDDTSWQLKSFFSKKVYKNIFKN